MPLPLPVNPTRPVSEVRKRLSFFAEDMKPFSFLPPACIIYIYNVKKKSKKTLLFRRRHEALHIYLKLFFFSFLPTA